MNAKLLIVMMMGLFAVGCASRRDAVVSTMGVSSGPMYRDAELKVLAEDKYLAPDCRTRKVVGTEIIEQPRVVATPRMATPENSSWPMGGSSVTTSADMPRGVTRTSRFVERWTVQRCNRRVTYRVTFEPDGFGHQIGVVLEQ
jgi:hypothetical protein